jgi:hypothetical protein
MLAIDAYTALSSHLAVDFFFCLSGFVLPPERFCSSLSPLQFPIVPKRHLASHGEFLVATNLPLRRYRNRRPADFSPQWAATYSPFLKIVVNVFWSIAHRLFRCSCPVFRTLPDIVSPLRALRRRSRNLRTSFPGARVVLLPAS